jgi:hypothetical protein
MIDAGIVRRRGTILEYDTAAVTAALPASVQTLLTARATNWRQVIGRCCRRPP